MPPALDRTSAPGRRTWSRIASPFSASKSRHIADFSVKADDEHKQYAPGDAVNGHVRLRVAKAFRVTHIVICLHGFAQVYKTPGAQIESPRAAGRGAKAGDGYATLFEDEVTLCGDGRLAEGVYQFQFELGFPERSLPSSIDFERGAITYMITATLTRPNSMSPAISCDRKLAFMDSIDIASLYPPRSRTITLEPLPKRTRTRNASRKPTDLSDRSSQPNEGKPGSETPRRSDASSSTGAPAEGRLPTSPVPSEISFDSRLSRSIRIPQPDALSRRSSTPSDSGKPHSSKTSFVNKDITVKIESQAGGCLQGDYIPVQVDVSHTKHVRSLYGVIVTFFRQARVDMRPAVPLGPTEKGKDPKSDEYYTKSFTGLGGLSLSGAGSSHTYRKDLCQVVRPLYIDPHALTTEVKARVRVPDEAFPTISTVPGSIISFRYYVEVVVDIQGKLQGVEKGLAGFSGQAIPSNHFLVEDLNVERSVAAPFGPAIIDTTPVQRDKGVVTCVFEVIIGTKDSERRKGKRKVVDAVEEPQSLQHSHMPSQPEHNAYPDADAYWYGADGEQDYHGYDEAYHYQEHHPSYDQSQYDYNPPPPAVPIPQIPDETEMTEKERIQQAEMRLLPSQPPGPGPLDNGDSAQATAPYLPGDLPTVAEWPGEPSGAEAHHDRPLAGPSSPPSGGFVGIDEEAQGGAPAHPADSNDQVDSSSRVTAPEPTAPTLADIDAPSTNHIHDSHADAAASSGLPKYER